MAKIAFIYTPSNDWIGGKNYYLSLFNKLNITASEYGHEVVVFSDLESNLDEFSNLERIEVIRTKVLSSYGPWRYLYRICNKILGLNSLMYLSLKNRKINILSHAYLPKWTKIKCLPWVPDLQHCFLPDNFSNHEIKIRNNNIKLYLKSGNVLFSSYSAINDTKIFFETKKSTLSAYRFTPLSSIDVDYDKYTKLLEEYGITKPYVFLPNQFWKHKNHLICFEACKIAKSKGKPFTLVCSGAFSDYRNPDYQKEISSYIESNDLKDYIKLLGLVPRNVFNCLLKESEILINPSLFEGWSTTVEEGKSNKKKMVLSDLDVHLEQTKGITNIWTFDRKSAESCFDSIDIALNIEQHLSNYEGDIVDDDINEIYSKLSPPKI